MNTLFTPSTSRRMKQPICAIVAIFVTVMLSANFVQSTSSIHWLGSAAVAA
jgi:hypothetical protein